MELFGLFLCCPIAFYYLLHVNWLSIILANNVI
nr:MAG TPA: hypothetical protein [Caudoviricetes sp.]